MKRKEFDTLARLAAAMGIQTSYESSLGGIRETSPEAMIAVLQALGIPLKTNLSNLHSLSVELRKERARHLCEPVFVAWGKNSPRISLNTPKGAADRRAEVQVCSEDGRLMEFKLKIIPDAAGKGCVTLPHTLPCGYYDLTVRAGRASAAAFLIVAPARVYQDPRFRRNTRSLGLFSPVYSLLSAQSVGIGDLGDFGRFLSWAGSAGCAIVGTLPLFACFVDGPVTEISPYAPVSRLFWNEIFINLGASGVTRGLDDGRLVDYQKAYRAKRKLLNKTAGKFFALGEDKSDEFQSFLREEPLVEDYGRFRAAGEKQCVLWQHWPARMRDGDLRDSDYDKEDFFFHIYSQWLFQKQLLKIQHAENKSRASLPALYLDFPLGVHRGGFDLWAMKSSFAPDASAGCPPDRAHPEGQDWGIIPLHPSAMRMDGYRYLRLCFAKQMKFCSILRLDHIMSLFRLYWAPQGLGPANGAYVRYPCEEMTAILSVESHRHKCTLIGEALGTVPPEIPALMKERNILRMYVQQRSLAPEPETAIKEPPEDCFAYFGTHDQPTFRGFWNYQDLKDKALLGRMTAPELKNKISDRRSLKAAVTAFFRKSRLLPAKPSSLFPVMTAFFRTLCRSPARAVILNIEDFWLEEKPQNTPATSTERPNWRRLHRFGLEKIERDRKIKNLIAALLKDRRRVRLPPA